MINRVIKTNQIIKIIKKKKRFHCAFSAHSERIWYPLEETRALADGKENNPKQAVSFEQINHVVVEKKLVNLYKLLFRCFGVKCAL